MLAGVVGPLAASVRASPDIAAAYAVSPYEIDCYGCLLLVRRTLRPTFKEVKLPTRMGRSLLIAEWRPEPDGAPIAVATAHFESLNSAPTRSKQLLAASTALAQYERAALVGDFNFDSTQNWGDWREVPPRPPRPSRDDDDDGGGEDVSDVDERMRYDRVLARGFRPASIDLMGEPAHGRVPPSDHFGLLAVLEVS